MYAVEKQEMEQGDGAQEGQARDMAQASSRR